MRDNTSPIALLRALRARTAGRFLCYAQENGRTDDSSAQGGYQDAELCNGEVRVIGESQTCHKKRHREPDPGQPTGAMYVSP